MTTVKTFIAALILVSASAATAAPCNAQRTSSGLHAHTAAPAVVKSTKTVVKSAGTKAIR